MASLFSVPMSLRWWWLTRAVVSLLFHLLLRWGIPPRRRFVPARSRSQAAPAPGSSGLGAEPCPHWRHKPEWVRREVVRLAARLGSCRRVAVAFNAIHRGQASVGKSWVAEFCRANASAIDAERRALRRRPPHAAPVRQYWSLDLTTVADDLGQPHTLLGLVDQGSCAALRLRVIARKCAWELLAQLCHAIAEHGKPRAIRTDNEGMFASRAWAAALSFVGIRRERIAPKCPWLNGRMERLFGTLKLALRQLSLPTASALQTALDEFAGFYNHVRVHQNLAGLTPAQAWHGLTPQDARRPAPGCWVQAFSGLLVGYWRRC